MTFTVKNYTSPDYPSGEAAATAAACYVGRKVEYRDGGFVSKGDIVQPVARPTAPAPRVFDEDFSDDGDIW